MGLFHHHRRDAGAVPSTTSAAGDSGRVTDVDLMLPELERMDADQARAVLAALAASEPKGGRR